MEMKMHIQSTETKYDYMGFNSKGHGLRINGDGNGNSPMENLLLSVAACSCIDIESLLLKMRNELSNLAVEITAQRAEEVIPKPFTAIHLHFKLFGKIKEKSATKAVAMAVEKYCSVSACLDPNIKISYNFEILE